MLSLVLDFVSISLYHVIRPCCYATIQFLRFPLGSLERLFSASLLSRLALVSPKIVRKRFETLVCSDSTASLFALISVLLDIHSDPCMSSQTRTFLTKIFWQVNIPLHSAWRKSNPPPYHHNCFIR